MEHFPYIILGVFFALIFALIAATAVSDFIVHLITVHLKGNRS